MRLVDPILKEFEREAATTRRVLERVPSDQLGWKPHPRSMSLGQLANHVATIPARVTEMITKDEHEMGRFEMPPAASTADLLANHDRSVDAAKRILDGMDDARMQGTWRMMRAGKPILAETRLAMARVILLNHAYHHRGQLTVYLRLLDVPLPSVYGPTADENPFA